MKRFKQYLKEVQMRSLGAPGQRGEFNAEFNPQGGEIASQLKYDKEVEAHMSPALRRGMQSLVRRPDLIHKQLQKPRRLIHKSQIKQLGVQNVWQGDWKDIEPEMMKADPEKTTRAIKTMGRLKTSPTIMKVGRELYQTGGAHRTVALKRHQSAPFHILEPVTNRPKRKK